MPSMRPLPDEHHSPKACNDADSRPTLRTGVHRIYLTAPLHAQAGSRSANWAITASLTSSCGCSTPGCSGSGLPIPQDTQGKPAIHYTTVYKVFLRRNS